MILKKSFLKIYFIFLITVIFTSCGPKKSEGPYFGNGFHNGWADQSSIVIWTRLTRNPEMNKNGYEFLIPDRKVHQKLKNKFDRELSYSSQMPEGADLNDMEGACPGASGEVKLIYHPLMDAEKVVETDWQKVDDDKNFTHQWELDELKPDTKYVVKIKARAGDGYEVSDEIEGSFRTPPAGEEVKDIDVCIVTCHCCTRKDDPDGHKIYTRMQNLFPDFYVHTGDIEYYDLPQPYGLTEELMRFHWDRLFALPLQRNFWKNTTTYFQKDDHDALCDDAYPGMSYGEVDYQRGLEIFDKEQFPTNNKPYKTVRWGKDLQIWLVEGRNFRSKNKMPDGPGKTLLGIEQKEWLFNTLKESDATFKIIITPGPILGPDRKGKKDNYSNSNWTHEGDEIRNYINQFDNVFICNGDRHWQYVTHWEDTNLWEFSCGAGSDVHAGGWNPNDKRPEHRFLRVKGGFLKGTVSREDGSPKITFQHYDVDGNVVHEEVFTKK